MPKNVLYKVFIKFYGYKHPYKCCNDKRYLLNEGSIFFIAKDKLIDQNYFLVFSFEHNCLLEIANYYVLERAIKHV